MTTQPHEEVLQNRFFRFSTQFMEIPRDPLQPFSSSDMNRIDGTQQEQEQGMLNFYGFKPLPGPVTEPLHYYSSDICQDKFMAIARTEGYRLIVFVADEASLLAFRRKYDFAGAMLPRMMMPAQPEPPNNTEMIRVSTRVLR